jgi:hypothetical protein
MISLPVWPSLQSRAYFSPAILYRSSKIAINYRYVDYEINATSSSEGLPLACMQQTRSNATTNDNQINRLLHNIIT